MEWWAATVAVLALSCAAVACRRSLVCFAALAAFMPLALYTIYRDFGSFWVLMALTFAVEVAALARVGRCRASAPYPAALAGTGEAAFSPAR